MGVVDQIIPEPLGGAQRDRAATMASVGKSIGAMLGELDGKDGETLVRERREKFLKMGGASLAA